MTATLNIAVDVTSVAVHVAGDDVDAGRIRSHLACLGFPPTNQGDDDEDR